MRYVYWKYRCNSSINKASVLEEQSIISFVSRLPLEGSSWHLIWLNINAFGTHDVSTMAMDQKKKTILLEEHRIFSFVSGLPLEESSWHLIWLNINEFATHDVNTIAMDQWGRPLYLENKLFFRLYLDFHKSHFRGTTYVALSTYALQIALSFFDIRL